MALVYTSAHYSMFLPFYACCIRLSPKYPVTRKLKSMRNAHISIPPFYGIGILANDLFYCPVAVNLRLKKHCSLSENWSGWN